MLVHPFDLLKVRAQLAGEVAADGKVSIVQIARKIVKTDGPLGLYSGLSAAAARQLIYVNLSLGIYGTLRDTMFVGQDPSGVVKLGMGCFSGGVAAFCSNPIEVTLVRMQADGRLPLAQRRNYSNIFNGLCRIGSEDGAKAYMAGVVPAILRAMIVNMLQVGGYDVAKSNIQNSTGICGVALYVSSALTAGFVCSAAVLPLDLAKTRMQNQRALADGTMLYKSLPQTISKIAASEGTRSLFNGFGPYFARSGAHMVLMFLFMEQYKKIADHYYPM